MLGRWRRWSAKLRRDDRGAVLVEFAICGTAFIALLVACAQTALVFFAQQTIQTVAEDMARKVLTGQVTTSNTSAAAFKQATCQLLPPYMTCSRVYVDVRKATTFADVDTSAMGLTYDSDGNPTNGWSYQTGGSGDIVILRVMYLWNTPPGPMGFNLSNQVGNSRLLTGTMVFKSETYS
jgi:Flp pilus assembly protein TadG